MARWGLMPHCHFTGLKSLQCYNRLVIVRAGLPLFNPYFASTECSNPAFLTSPYFPLLTSPDWPTFPCLQALVSWSWLICPSLLLTYCLNAFSFPFLSLFPPISHLPSSTSLHPCFTTLSSLSLSLSAPYPMRNLRIPQPPCATSQETSTLLLCFPPE